MSMLAKKRKERPELFFVFDFSRCARNLPYDFQNHEEG